jgi:hypothetical protein
LGEYREVKRAPSKTYIQMKEGVWYAIQYDIELTECCSCGLVHRTYWKVEKGRIYWRAAVDHRKTAAARKRLGVRIETKPVPPRAVASGRRSAPR